MRFRFGDCELDADTRQLFVRGVEVHLQPKAFQFLELLIHNRPRVVSKTEIHENLWPGTFVSDGTLTSLLAEVRDSSTPSTASYETQKETLIAARKLLGSWRVVILPYSGLSDL